MPSSSDSPGRPDATGESRPALERECRTFTRYLTGRDPNDYVTLKYTNGQRAVVRNAPAVSLFDAALVRFATLGPWRTRIADAYARVFCPRGVLRWKLILMIAILENTKGFHQNFTAGGDGSRPAAALRIAGAVTAFILALGAGVLVLGPRQLLGGQASGRGPAR